MGLPGLRYARVSGIGRCLVVRRSAPARVANFQKRCRGLSWRLWCGNSGHSAPVAKPSAPLWVSAGVAVGRRQLHHAVRGMLPLPLVSLFGSDAVWNGVSENRIVRLLSIAIGNVAFPEHVEHELQHGDEATIACAVLGSKSVAPGICGTSSSVGCHKLVVGDLIGSGAWSW